jgi:tetratricopeptide (TPR) repeat protein
MLRPIRTLILILMVCVPATAGISTDDLIALLANRVTQNPRSVDALNRLGEALMRKGGETGEIAWYLQADIDFQAAAKLDPSSGAVLRNLAWVRVVQCEFEDAVDYAQRAIRRNNSDPQAYGILADASMELGDYEMARDDAGKMLRLRSDSTSLGCVAQVRWIYGDTKGAVQAMRKAVQACRPLTEDAAWCRAQLGEMYLRTGNPKAAEEQFNRALRDKPGFTDALAGLATISIARKKLPDAASLLVKATAGSPRIADVIELGDLYRKMGKADDAEDQYAQVEALVCDHLSRGIEGDELTLAMFYLDHDRKLPEALELAQVRIREGRRTVQAYATRAWAYYKYRQYPEARKDIEQAMRTNVRDALLFYRAGKIYQALGDTHRMRTSLSKAVALNPSFHILYAQDAARTLRATAPRKAVTPAHHR